MKQLLAIVLLGSFFTFSTSCAERVTSETENQTTTKSSTSAVIHLTKETFIEKVFDFEKNKEWKYNGSVPAILDFYADWCGPCKMLAPVLEELQKEYGGKIQVYKINTDKERELAAAFGIQSLPTIVFVPVQGNPEAALGFRPKEELDKIIQDVLKVSK